MRVQIGLTETGKMFTVAQHSGIVQPTQELPRVEDNFFWIIRNCTRTHHRARCTKRQIHHRREIGIETYCPARFADHIAMLAEQLAVAACENVRSGRRRTNHILQPVNPATLHIHTQEHRGRN